MAFPLRGGLAVCVACAVVFPLRAEMRLARVFQDQMVMQREMPAPVWGWADPGAEVTVAFAGQKKTGRADAQGAWKVVLDPLSASAEGREMTVTASGDTRTLKDVVVGEIWLCAGQSNMARTLKHDAFEFPRFHDYAKDADFPGIRFIAFAPHASDRPLDEFDPVVQRDARWKILSGKTAMEVMSLGFFFAKDVHRELGVPVGLIQVAVSGTPQTAWIAREVLDAVAAKYPASPSWEAAFARAEENLAKGKDSFKTWAAFVETETAWKADPKGRWPGSTQGIPDYPAVLFNGLVHPLAPLAFRGVLWHQGEGGPATHYRERLVAQVADWRKIFGHDFHFIWGSMTRNTGAPPPLSAQQVGHRGAIDEEFLLAERDFGPEGKATLVGFFDLGDQSTHWGQKEEGGRRMAAAALSEVYGKTGRIFTGPVLEEAVIEGATVRAKFRHVGGGLVYEPSIDGISGFVLEQKGANPELQWAEVKVAGDTVTLSHPKITKPTNAYYGFFSNPHETLFNKEGFPAFPFRAVPRVFGAKGASGPLLVSADHLPDRASLHVSHVRRAGYMFSVNFHRGSGEVTVRAALPAEWAGAVVTSGGKPVETGPLHTAPDGQRYFEFPVAVNSPAIVVADSAHPPDFSGIDRF